MIGSPPLPTALLRNPIAHRGLHDKRAGRPENSLGAISAAIDAGYAIELDVQLTGDGNAVVFHDATLDRMTPASGRVDALKARDLAQIALKDSDEKIPTLREVLNLVGGRTPVLIELKDQSGGLCPAPDNLERAVASDLDAYTGDAAVMSYNPNMVDALARLLPKVARGVVTEAYGGPEFSAVAPEILRTLLRGPDLQKFDGAFVSHDAVDLDRPWVAQYRKSGYPILCWTVRSTEDEARARQKADNVTFEGYMARHPTP